MRTSIPMRVCCYLFAIAFILIGWYITAIALDTPALPTPVATLKVFWGYVPALLPDFWISMYRVIVSMVVGAAPAVVIALTISRSPRLDALFAPVLYLLYPIPKIVILPILLVLLGLADAPKIVLIAITVFFQTLVTVRDAARAVPQDSILSIESLGATRIGVMRHVVLPATMPSVLTSLRVGTGTAIAVLFFAEAIAGSTGLGYFIMQSWALIDYARMFSGIIAMALLGVIIYAFIDVLERRLTRWKRDGA